MKKPDYSRIHAIKENVKIAYIEFREKYKKVTRGIEELKTLILLSNDIEEIERLSAKFFGYITKSVKAKKMKKELEESW